MRTILSTNISLPLEREYEAWIIADIEKYLTALGYSYRVWAVNPKQEAIWPADETVTVNSKLIGLQFKRPHLANGKASKDRVKWQLHEPKNQFHLLKSHPEIFYCFPTFINRDYRAQSLNHCVFWRPSEMSSDLNVWYENPKARTENKCLKSGMRWGLFWEEFVNCNIGLKVSCANQLSEACRKISSDIRRLSEISSYDDDFPTSSSIGNGLYMLLVSGVWN